MELGGCDNIPPGEKIKIALRIDSRVTNNEAEYEAVLAGIQAAREVGASRIILYSDSQLITQQIKGVYEAKDDRMHKYLQLIKTKLEVFMDWGMEQIPREENNEADSLAKIAPSISEASTRELLHVSRLILSTYEETIPAPEDSWLTSLIKFITTNELPEDKARAQKIKRQAPRWSMSSRRFMKSVALSISEEYLWPGRQCLSGSCGQLLAKMLPEWSIPAKAMKSIWASCPFDQWDMDIVGPFPIARGQKKFLLVAVDYFSKWVEAEPLAKITEQEVLKFLWKNIGREITSWCQEIKITQSFTFVAYPQSNGQTEVVNRIIVQALKTQLQGKRKDWVEELPSILWAYRTTPRARTQETPFSLVYGSEAVLQVEIGQTSSRVESYPESNEQNRAMELDLVEERRDRAMIRIEAYRSWVMKMYNKKVRVRDFQVGDLVMKKVNQAGMSENWKLGGKELTE
ncbi:uncharacterized protein [Primulina eburnea]|uniref:uncharacterized protein n=1 Tax=Primulina eburnea TaxID=1245227 RepID=UPI003C6C8BD9